MRKSVLVLAISLLANVALVLFAGRRAVPALQPHDARPVIHPVVVAESALFTKSPNAIMAALEEEHLPREFIIAVARERIIGEIRQRHEAEINAAIQRAPWWKVPLLRCRPELALSPDQRVAQHNENASARYALLKLMGADALDSDGSVMARYPGFSRDDAVAADLIAQDYREMNDEVMLGARGLLTAADRKQLADIESQKQHDLAETLTRDEHAILELRVSHSDWVARFQYFQPTETELLAIASAENSNTRTTEPTSSSADNDALRSTLGEERYRDWQSSTLPCIQALGREAEISGLTLATQREVGQLLLSATNQSTEIATHSEVSVSERQAKISALAKDTELQLNQKLGRTVASKYMTQSLGWLREMEGGSSVRFSGAQVITARPR